MDQRINELWTWVSVNEATGEEQVLVLDRDEEGNRYELCSRDGEKMRGYKEHMLAVSKELGLPVALIRFSSRSVEEVVKGGSDEGQVH